MKKLLIPFSLLTVLLVYSCAKPLDPVTGTMIPFLPDTPYDYNDELPASMAFEGDIPYTSFKADEAVTLGRVLFYDTKISLNNKTACASCHIQQKGFADPAAFSEGFQFLQTPRNSMTIVNAAFTGPYFWDQRAEILEEQVMMPIENHIEMGLDDFELLVEKVEKLDYYPSLFEDAFGSDEVNAERIGLALADFMRSIVSYRTKYDEGVEINFANFTPLEIEGKQLFENEMMCGSCHGGIHFRGWGSANIGLDEEYADQGQGEWSAGMEGWFKIPSLRNVAVTGPYMHDGRFATLDDVLEHYSTGIQDHPGLDFRLRENFGGWGEPDPTNNGPIKMNMTDHEKAALKAFLHTLTDDAMMSDERYSNPFRLVEN
ncbi:MAG: cytochrome c peroxidase [Bacteroidota bacterium]